MTIFIYLPVLNVHFHVHLTFPITSHKSSPSLFLQHHNLNFLEFFNFIIFSGRETYQQISGHNCQEAVDFMLQGYIKDEVFFSIFIP